eukprot:3771327-Prymnesium_polylepis.1
MLYRPVCAVVEAIAIDRQGNACRLNACPSVGQRLINSTARWTALTCAIARHRPLCHHTERISRADSGIAAAHLARSLRCAVAQAALMLPQGQHQALRAPHLLSSWLHSGGDSDTHTSQPASRLHPSLLGRRARYPCREPPALSWCPRSDTHRQERQEEHSFEPVRWAPSSSRSGHPDELHFRTTVRLGWALDAPAGRSRSPLIRTFLRWPECHQSTGNQTQRSSRFDRIHPPNDRKCGIAH